MRAGGKARALKETKYTTLSVPSGVGGSRVFNLGTGDGFSVREVVEHAAQVTKKTVPIIESVRRPGDCTKLLSGSSRAVSELGWSATRSNMKQMITDAWRWHQNGDYEK